MFNSRNQVRWFQEQWRRNNEREDEIIEQPVSQVMASAPEIVLENSAKHTETLVANGDAYGARVAAARAKYALNLAKYFANTNEPTITPTPVHRRNATR